MTPHPIWTVGPRSRVEDLYSGTRALTIYGVEVTIDRRDGANHGAWRVRLDDGSTTWMCARAEVVVLPATKAGVA